MPLDLLLLAIGGALLYYGAEWLVEGAAGLALRLGVSPLLVGLTIVSYATSSPELVVSVSAALKNDGPLVLGNVIGSNIANIGFILGLTALIAPPMSDGTMARKELVILFLTTASIPLFMLDGELGRLEGTALVLGSIIYTWLTIRWSKSRPVPLSEVPKEEPRGKGLLIGIGTVGIVVLIFGGELFVRGAVGLAAALGVDQRIVGLTVVALGTSVPELATSVVAALKGHSDLAIGNVVGSNIFNALLVLGVACLITPFPTDLVEMRLDLTFLSALTLGAVVVLSRVRRITRFEGALLMASYLGFLALLAMEA